MPVEVTSPICKTPSGYPEVPRVTVVCWCVCVCVCDCPDLLTSTLCTLFSTHMGFIEQVRQMYLNSFSK